MKEPQVISHLHENTAYIESIADLNRFRIDCRNLLDWNEVPVDSNMRRLREIVLLAASLLLLLLGNNRQMVHNSSQQRTIRC